MTPNSGRKRQLEFLLARWRMHFSRREVPILVPHCTRSDAQSAVYSESGETPSPISSRTISPRFTRPMVNPGKSKRAAVDCTNSR